MNLKMAASIVLRCSTWSQSSLCDHVFYTHGEKNSSARSLAPPFQITTANTGL